MSTSSQHPAWCDDHQAFPGEPDDNWHSSSPRVLGDHEIYISTGTITGEVEVFIDEDEGVTLEAAEAWAKLILKMVEAARATLPSGRESTVSA